jgi:hypothetical protein
MMRDKKYTRRDDGKSALFLFSCAREEEEFAGDTQHHRVKRLPLSAPTVCPTISRCR